MKAKIKKIITLFTLIILLCSTSLADITATVNTSALILREAPNKSSKSILAIPEGESIKILSVDGDWSKIIYGDQKGFVMNKYLKFDSTSVSPKHNFSKIDLNNIEDNLEPCRVGDKGENIILLQNALKKLSLFDGNIDGSFGPATEKAVKKLQDKNSIKADGIVGKGTIEIISNALNKTTNNGSNTYNKVNSISDIGEAPNAMRPGESGNDVVKLQQALNVLGYYKSDIDGNYGKSTENAVKKFQKKRGLGSDGIAGDGTISVLFNVPRKKPEKIEKEKLETEQKSSNSSSNLENIFSIEDIGSTPSTSKPGDKGENVIKLQQALALINMYKGNIDGNYGEGTQNAVKAFQKKKGMSADGIAGPSTIKYLFGAPAANASSYTSVLSTSKNKQSSDSVNLIETLDDIGSTPSTSKPGESGNDVVKLQQALSLLGYYRADINGYYDDNTKAAVKKFQKKRGMNADGIAGASTIRIMFGEPAHDNGSQVSVSNSESVNSIQEIGSVPNACKPGFKGEDVKKLQQALNLLGYYDGKIDGSYGASTENAVKRFQKKRGMNADGLAGVATIRVLFGKAPKAEKLQAKENNKEIKNDPAMNGIHSIKDIGDIPKTSKPGNYSKDVKMLQQALSVLGYYDDTIDSKYGESTKQAVIRFQKKRGMNADGVAGASTIRLIFGKSPKNSTVSKEAKQSYKTEMLDWFAGNAGNLKIPRKAVFEIKDCRTGLVFKAKRWAGVNHIDAEPLTANDTKIMKTIFGGFSWARRSVLVKYNGHVYAASIHNMPHGTTTIHGNGYEGHFCIHTLNSKTHGSKKVDTEHQNMVKKALKYSW